MGEAAYKTSIRSGGVSTPFTAEATTSLGGNAFQITNAVRRVIDRKLPVVVRAGSTVVVPTSINYLFGIVQFSSAQTGAVTIDASFIPLGLIGGSTEYSLEIGGDILDDTSFDLTNTNGGFRTKMYGLLDVSVSVGRNDDLSQAFKNFKLTRSEVLIEIRPGGGTEVARGWFVLESVGSSGDVGGLEAEDLQFKLKDELGFAFGNV